jgi:hypothetical protein
MNGPSGGGGKAVACLSAVTRDIASPCSGHGFKHSAAIGEALAELAMTGTTRFDLSEFKLAQLR